MNENTNIFERDEENVEIQGKALVGNVEIPIDLKQGGFKKYKNLEEIVDKIVNDFTEEPVYTDKQTLTYVLSSSTDGQSQAGIVSICPSLLTAMRLYDKLSDDNAKKDTLKNQIENAICKLLKQIYQQELNQAPLESFLPILSKIYRDIPPIFDASPYESIQFRGQNQQYIDSISWAVPVFLEIMYLEKIDFPDTLRDIARYLAQWCLNYINTAVISDEKGTKGWNFTKISDSTKTNASLYFTYAVSTIYMSFYSKYGDIIGSLRTIEPMIDEPSIDKDKNVWDYKADLSELQNKMSIESDIKMLCKKENEKKLEDLMFFNDFRQISNQEKDTESKDFKNTVGNLSKLRWYLLEVSQTLWAKFDLRDGNFKKEFENNFFQEDTDGKLATEEYIRNTGRTNTLFTGLLIIGIMMNAGYDKQFSKTNTKNNDDDDYEYRKFQNKLFVHVAKVQRLYDDLEQEDKSFFVDTLMLTFNESFDTETKILVNQMRKENIRVMPLSTMLLKTNHLLSEYIIQYPQKQMVASLQSIAKSRYTTDKGPKWLWEKDNYHAISNYYYVDAIFNFYRYYETYEKKYVVDYDETVKEIANNPVSFPEVQKELERQNEIFEADKKANDAELKTAKEEVERQEAKIREIENKNVGYAALDNSMVSVILNNPTFYKELIKGIRKQLAEDISKKYEINERSRGTVEKIKVPIDPKENTLFAMIQAMFVDILLPSAVKGAQINPSGKIKLGKSGKFHDGEPSYPEQIIENAREYLINQDGFAQWIEALMKSALVWPTQ